jgi:hypothetical protein
MDILRFGQVYTQNNETLTKLYISLVYRLLHPQDDGWNNNQDVAD